MMREPIEQHVRYNSLRDEFDLVFQRLSEFQRTYYDVEKRYWHGLLSHPLQRLETGVARQPVRNDLPRGEKDAWDVIGITSVLASYLCESQSSGVDHPAYTLIAEIQYDERGKVEVYRQERLGGRHYTGGVNRHFATFRVRQSPNDSA